MKITVTLPKGSGIMLEEFSKLKICGDTLEENGSWLLMRALSDLAGTVGFRHLTEALKKRLDIPTATIVPLKTTPVERAVLVPVVQETEEDRIARENWQNVASKQGLEPVVIGLDAGGLDDKIAVVVAGRAPVSGRPPVDVRELVKTLDAPAPIAAPPTTRAFPNLTGRPRAPAFKGAVLAADKMPGLTDGQRRVFDVYREADGYALSLSEVCTLARVPHGSVSHHRDCLVKKGYAVEHRFPGGEQALRIIVGGEPRHADNPAAKSKAASEDIQKAAAQALGSEIAREEPAAPVPVDDAAVLVEDLSVRMQVLLRSFLTFGAALPRNDQQLATHCGLERSKLPFLLNRLRELKLIEGTVAVKWILTEKGRKLALQIPVVIPSGPPPIAAKQAETKVTYPVVRRPDPAPTFGKTLSDPQREAIDKHLATKGARTFEPGASAEPWLLEEQLRKKGHIVSRVASAGWIVDGKKRTQEDVVAMINKYRAAVDLPPLTAPPTK